MATVKEVELMKDGQMVSPVTIIDSVKNLDGTKYKDVVYKKSEFPTVFLEKIYPVGSIYISVNNVSPASFLGGTWSQLSAGYALWTASSNAGEIINAGLPNISGESSQIIAYKYNSSSGAFNGSARSDSLWYASTNSDNNIAIKLKFDASKSNSIYGNSSTVQPPAYKVYAWKRTA